MCGPSEVGELQVTRLVAALPELCPRAVALDHQVYQQLPFGRELALFNDGASPAYPECHRGLLRLVAEV